MGWSYSKKKNHRDAIRNDDDDVIVSGIVIMTLSLSLIDGVTGDKWMCKPYILYIYCTEPVTTCERMRCIYRICRISGGVALHHRQWGLLTVGPKLGRSPPVLSIWYPTQNCLKMDSKKVASPVSSMYVRMCQCFLSWNRKGQETPCPRPLVTAFTLKVHVRPRCDRPLSVADDMIGQTDQGRTKTRVGGDIKCILMSNGHRDVFFWKCLTQFFVSFFLRAVHTPQMSVLLPAPAASQQISALVFSLSSNGCVVFAPLHRRPS